MAISSDTIASHLGQVVFDHADLDAINTVVFASQRQHWMLVMFDSTTVSNERDLTDIEGWAHMSGRETDVNKSSAKSRNGLRGLLHRLV